MALGVGGLAQLLAGMWEFAAGNTFGATGECGTLIYPLQLQTRWRNPPSISGLSGAWVFIDTAARFDFLVVGVFTEISPRLLSSAAVLKT